jgi:hypothetical protein
MDPGKMSFVAGSLVTIAILAVLLFNLLTIQLVSPGDRLKITDRTPVFEWSGMQAEYVILVDDNADFTSPISANVEGNSYRPDRGLDFGTYYWKVGSGPFSSGVGRFTVLSSVVVSRNESELKNEGNTEVILSGPSITGAFVLGVNESAQIGKDANVEAEQA